MDFAPVFDGSLMEEVVVVRAMNEPVRGSIDVGTLRVERSFA
jgi:hypothetical protein